jgi:hypothetical protein
MALSRHFVQRTRILLLCVPARARQLGISACRTARLPFFRVKVAWTLPFSAQTEALTFATSTVEPPALVECRWTGGAPLARPCALCREGCSGSRGWVAPPRNSTTRGTARSFLGENRKRGPKTAAPLVIREHAQLKRASERTREGSAGAVDGRPHNGADAYLPASTRCNMTGSACLTAPTATD